MPKLSVCIETFWGSDKAPQDKIISCKELGFKTIEFWNWANKDLAELEAAVRKTGMKVATFCVAADRKLVEPYAEAGLIEGLRKTAAVAAKLGVDRLILTTGNERKAESFEVTRRTVVRNLKAMVPVLEETGLILMIEPLNPIVNHLGYWLTRMPDAADIAMEVGHPKVKLLMDIYHQQITEGNIIDNIRQYSPVIGHFHCAGVPGRNELVGGELDYRGIFKAIDATGYDGYVGLEFKPKGDTAAALREALGLVG